MSPIVVWFRQDLRIADNPALHFATKSKQPVVCIYVLDDKAAGAWKWGGASRWWLHHSLETLAEAIAKKGAKLILRKGAADKIVAALAKKIHADTVVWNRCYEPFAIATETRLGKILAKSGIKSQSFNSSLLHEPWELKTKADGSYHVFTPFWRAARQRPHPEKPHPIPRSITPFRHRIASDALSAWKLLPHKPDWASGLRQAWEPGEAAARERLKEFADHLAAYPEGRDRPDRDHTSRLSPHLHWGEISPRQVWHTIAAHHGSGGEKFLSELGWREFSYHLLFHNPDLPHKPLRKKFAKFRWRYSAKDFHAWTKGKTGVPTVDAGMRQLWQTGWMHNRVRMIVASYLIKHLLLDWKKGEEWFWDTLVDADLANNSENWQWVAGCGADASPFFRIFNPVIQGEKFDPDGKYVRRYVPELKDMPNKHIHAPWRAPDDVLQKAKVTLDDTYPKPLVDLDEGRKRALAAFKKLR